MMKKVAFGSAALALWALVLGAPASAAGCGGYVNLAVWGCAPWDNNPPKKGVTPGYSVPKPVPQPTRPVVLPNSGGRFISDQGAGLTPNKSGGIISDHASGVRSGAGVINPANTSSSFRR
jgi:hypothetical protein